MSYYYDYYIGYESGGKIYPLGPYNCFGDICAVVSRSRSFASDLHESFRRVEDDRITEELRKDFEYKDFDDKTIIDVRYLPFDELPAGTFIRNGYFLKKDVAAYLETGDTWDLFYERVDPVIYAGMIQDEIMFGRKPKPEDEDAPEVYSASDYIYFAYPDYSCPECEAHLIREAAEGLESYMRMPEDAKLVVLETEG